MYKHYRKNFIMKIYKIANEFEDEGRDSLEMPERESFQQEQEIKEDFETKVNMWMNLGMGEMGNFEKFHIIESDPVNKKVTIQFGE